MSDPINDFNAWDAEQNRKLNNLPICDNCGQLIQQESAVYYNDQWICEDCEHDFWNYIRDDFLERVETDE